MMIVVSQSAGVQCEAPCVDPELACLARIQTLELRTMYAL